MVRTHQSGVATSVWLVGIEQAGEAYCARTTCQERNVCSKRPQLIFDKPDPATCCGRRGLLVPRRRRIPIPRRIVGVEGATCLDS